MKNISDNLVLIVDDSPININILFNSLNELYDVTTAKDGESALKSISKNPPDLVLLDVEMPGINGYEVCRRIRANEKTTHIPVIFVTSLSGIQDEIKGLGLGAVDFITKPFNSEIVKIRVKNQLELKALRDHLERLVEERTKELELRTKEVELTQDTVIECIVSMGEYRNTEIGEHIIRTQSYVKALAEELKRTGEFKAKAAP
ncbi:MAG: response regulator [Lentisphaerota bacterium]